jgi:hypothetical protein
MAALHKHGQTTKNKWLRASRDALSLCEYLISYVSLLNIIAVVTYQFTSVYISLLSLNSL